MGPSISLHILCKLKGLRQSLIPLNATRRGSVYSPFQYFLIHIIQRLSEIHFRLYYNLFFGFPLGFLLLFLLSLLFFSDTSMLLQSSQYLTPPLFPYGPWLKSCYILSYIIYFGNPIILFWINIPWKI